MTKFSTLLAATLVAASSTVAFAAGENSADLYIDNTPSFVEGRNSADVIPPRAENNAGINAFITGGNRMLSEGRNSAEATPPRAENNAGINAFITGGNRVVTEGRNAVMFEAPVTEVDVRRF